MLARAAASLDLLSGGRLDLTLGTDVRPTAARSSPTSGRGLDEAIEVIRGVLDAGETGPLRYPGSHYRVPEAQRGPLPAHRIPIWLNAHAHHPGALELTGRAADGWMSELSRFQPGELATAYKIIDEAAAGGRPRARGDPPASHRRRRSDRGAAAAAGPRGRRRHVPRPI